MTIEAEVFAQLAQHLNTTHLLPGCSVGLNRARRVVVVSDYVDSVGPFQTLAFVVATADSWCRWKSQRDEWRRQAALHGRRVKYTKLDDPHCQRNIRRFLEAANTLDGTLFTIAVDRRIGSLFKETGKLALEDFEVDELPVKVAAMERLMRITHSVAAGVAGLAPLAQEVFWVTDDDAIAGNEVIAHGTGLIALDALRSGVGRGVRLAFGAPSGLRDGDERLLWEDLLSIPDLAAGAVAACLADGMSVDRSGLVVPVNSGPEKARLIGRWFASENSRLRKLLCVIRDGETGSSTIDWVRFVPVGTTVA